MTAPFDALRDCTKPTGHLPPAFGTTAPVQPGRSFLYDIQSAPRLRHGTAVNLTEEYPVDPLTLQPLVVLVDSADIKSAPKVGVECHHLYWPRRSEELGLGWHGIAERPPRGKLAGIALRVSLAEMVTKDEHDALDRIAPVGPTLPVDSESKAARIVMAVCKVRSRFAVETRDGRPHIVQLTEGDFEQLNTRLGLEYFWSPKRSNFGQRILAQYFARKVACTAVATAPMHTRQAFLEGNKEEKKEAAYALAELGLRSFMQLYEPHIALCRREGSYAQGAQLPLQEVMALLRASSIDWLNPSFEKVLHANRPKTFQVPNLVA